MGGEGGGYKNLDGQSLVFKILSFQMASRRTLSLLGALKQGLHLDFDPSGERNKCCYQCLGKHLKVLDVEDVICALEQYMLHNRLIPVENKVS